MTDVYLYAAALLCADCGEAQRADLRASGDAPEDEDDESSYDSDDFPKGPYPDGRGEADSPQHCDHCHVFLENPLTDDGRTYVQEQVRLAYATKDFRGSRDVVSEWRVFYDIPSPNDDDGDDDEGK